MSYRPEFEDDALTQVNGLPPEAFDALSARIADLVDQPWDAHIDRPGDSAYRWTTFGDAGLVSFYVDDDAEVLRIYHLTWAG